MLCMENGLQTFESLVMLNKEMIYKPLKPWLHLYAKYGNGLQTFETRVMMNKETVYKPLIY